MDMFEEIYDVAKELPKFSSVYGDIKKNKYNVYQYLTMCIGFICFLIGIVLGNVFPACSASSTIYTDVCEATEFNILLMISIWFVSFIMCLFLYGIGEIIRLLNEIIVKK